MDERGPKEPAVTRPPTTDAAATNSSGSAKAPVSLLGTAWRLMSAPTTLLVLGLLMGLYLT